MRVLLIFIIILNLLYAGWEFLNPAENRNEIGSMSDSLKKLELLNEPESAIKPPAANVLENEPDDKERLKQVADVNSRVDVNGVAIDSISCYTLGPFKDKNIMQQLRETIAEYVTDVTVRKRKESEKHRYWVYVAALPDRKQARLTAKQLRQKGINDFYIVLSGGSKNSISLGHFREPKHANLIMKRVIDLGFKAGIEVIYRDYDIYWLDYKVDGGGGESGFTVKEYISEGISQLARDC